MFFFLDRHLTDKEGARGR